MTVDFHTIRSFFGLLKAIFGLLAVDFLSIGSLFGLLKAIFRLLDNDFLSIRSLFGLTEAIFGLMAVDFHSIRSLFGLLKAVFRLLDNDFLSIRSLFGLLKAVLPLRETFLVLVAAFLGSAVEAFAAAGVHLRGKTREKRGKNENEQYLGSVSHNLTSSLKKHRYNKTKRLPI